MQQIGKFCRHAQVIPLYYIHIRFFFRSLNFQSGNCCKYCVNAISDYDSSLKVNMSDYTYLSCFINLVPFLITSRKQMKPAQFLTLCACDTFIIFHRLNNSSLGRMRGIYVETEHGAIYYSFLQLIAGIQNRQCNYNYQDFTAGRLLGSVKSPNIQTKLSQNFILAVRRTLVRPVFPGGNTFSSTYANVTQNTLAISLHLQK